MLRIFMFLSVIKMFFFEKSISHVALMLLGRGDFKMKFLRILIGISAMLKDISFTLKFIFKEIISKNRKKNCKILINFHSQTIKHLF